MAIEKPIILDNGVTVTYFRVTSLTVVVNVQSIIELTGYTSADKRAEERESIIDPEGSPANVFVDTRIISIDYDPFMSVAKAYDYVKSLPEFQGAEDVIDAWAAGSAYYTDDLVMDGEKRYRCIQPHTSQEGWEPHNTPALWAEVKDEGDIPVWSQPDASNPFMKGDKVRYPDAEGPVYESTIDNNVWSPADYPQGWQLVEGGE